jgi:hypothetical protein
MPMMLTHPWRERYNGCARKDKNHMEKTDKQEILDAFKTLSNLFQMKKTSLFFYLMLIALLAFKLPDDSLFRIPQNWPKPHYDFNKNPLTKEKIILGRTLFYDPILSADNSI